MSGHHSNRRDARGGDAYFGDPAGSPDLAPVADRVRTVLRAPELSPRARDTLRAQLVIAAAEQIQREAVRRETSETVIDSVVARRSLGSDAGTDRQPVLSQPVLSQPVLSQPVLSKPVLSKPVLSKRDRGARRLPSPRPQHHPVQVWLGRMVAAAAVAAVVAGTISLTGTDDPGVHVFSALAGAVSVDPEGPVQLTFDQTLDHAATVAALRLTPATAVRTSWHNNTLTVAPVHGFAPNSAYQLTINARRAHAGGDDTLSSDVHLTFGTAPAAKSATSTEAAVDLRPVAASMAGSDSEAAVTRDGALLLTDDRAPGQTAGLVRISAGKSQRLATPTSAICVSRSGDSVAFLNGAGSATNVVFADSTGSPLSTVSSEVDSGSPLGWIGDQQVTFVSGGRLTAVDRQGGRRLLSGVPIDAEHDTLVLAPGGRYAYLRPANGAGRVLDLSTGTSRPLPAAIGEPAFTADGAGIVWLARTGSRTMLQYSASSGGPATSAPLPVSAGDDLSDLAVSPDGSELAYSVSRTDHQTEFRLASLPDGQTLAHAVGLKGESPNWSPDGRFFTVLAQDGRASRIESVPVPSSLSSTTTQGNTTSQSTTTSLSGTLPATLTAFTTAQIAADPGAEAWLSEPGVRLPQPARPTRATVLWSNPGPGGTTTAGVRLTIDPQPGRTTPRQAIETISISAPTAAGPGKVRSVSVGPYAPAPAGPQVLSAGADATTGTARLTFDSDLDPRTVPGGIKVTWAGGVTANASTSYDAATRTVTIRSPQGRPVAPQSVAVTPALRDVNGQAAATVHIPCR